MTIGESSNEEVYTLGKYVVTASGFEQELIQAPASISVVSQLDLSMQPFATLNDAVKDLPGVRITKSKSGDDISIRGLGSDYTLILIDGKRQNSREMRPNGFGEAETGFVPPVGAIERIEVVRGPMSTLYGSDAMGGVINVITKKVAPRWGGSLSADYLYQLDDRLGNARSGSFYLNGPLVNSTLGLAIWGRKYHRSEDNLGVTTNSPSRVGAREGDINTVGARISYTPTANHDIILEGGSTHQRYSGTLGKTGTMGDAAGYDGALRFIRDYASLSHTGRWGFGTSDVMIQYEDSETKGRRLSGSPVVSRKLGIENWVADAKLVMPLPYNHVTIGGQYIDSQGEDGVTPDDLSMQQFSLFLEDEIRIWKPLALTGGIRYDHHDKFGDHYSPRAYLVWNVTPNFALKGGVSTGFKTPKLTQTVEGVGGIGRQGRLPIFGNKDLQPETMTAYEVGFYLHKNSKFSLSAMVFLNKFKDKISSVTIYANDPRWPSTVDPNDWPNTGTTPASGSLPINIDTAETKGVEDFGQAFIPQGPDASAQLYAHQVGADQWCQQGQAPDRHARAYSQRNAEMACRQGCRLMAAGFLV